MLRPYRHGAHDPTFQEEPDGAVWRGIRTPQGPATLRVASSASLGEVGGTAWGPGAEWALDRVPRMLGEDDDPTGFEPPAPLRDAHRRHPGLRFGSSGLVVESLVPVVLQQKVTGQEALSAYRRLVHWYGDRAPGPGAERRLWVQPDVATMRAIPSWEWLRLPVDGGRARPLLRALQAASALERAAQDSALLDRRLCSLPGVGVWTSAEVRQRVCGDADAPSFGDYHIPRHVCWVLAGVEDGDDELMAELLEPYRPHRGRVVRLMEVARLGMPRRGPRMAPRTHLPRR